MKINPVIGIGSLFMGVFVAVAPGWVALTLQDPKRAVLHDVLYKDRGFQLESVFTEAYVVHRVRTQMFEIPSSPGTTHVIALPEWSPLLRELRVMSVAMPGRIHREVASGWPFRSMVGYELSDGKFVGLWPIVYRTGLMKLSPNSSPYTETAWAIRGLPVQPIWLGMVLNTLFFTAGCYGLGWSAQETYRWFIGALRVRKGLCRTCAYPIAGERCPECATVTSRQ